MRKRVKESVCERERERGHVCEKERVKERVWERERGRVCVCERERMLSSIKRSKKTKNLYIVCFYHATFCIFQNDSRCPDKVSTQSIFTI